MCPFSVSQLCQCLLKIEEPIHNGLEHSTQQANLHEKSIEICVVQFCAVLEMCVLSMRFTNWNHSIRKHLDRRTHSVACVRAHTVQQWVAFSLSHVYICCCCCVQHSFPFCECALIVLEQQHYWYRRQNIFPGA